VPKHWHKTNISPRRTCSITESIILNLRARFGLRACEKWRLLFVAQHNSEAPVGGRTAGACLHVLARGNGISNGHQCTQQTIIQMKHRPMSRRRKVWPAVTPQVMCASDEAIQLLRITPAPNSGKCSKHPEM